MGCPDKTVVNIAGDGCFRMNMNEIATAVRCGKPLVQIILNNHVLGMVRQWQTLFYEQRYSQTILNDGVDFVKVSEAMGAKAIRVTKMEEVEPALKMALSSEGPVVPVAKSSFLQRIPRYAIQKFCISFFFASCAIKPIFIRLVPLSIFSRLKPYIQYQTNSRKQRD